MRTALRTPLRALAGLLLAGAALHAQAWWNADWSTRTRVTLDTQASGGVAIQAPVQALPLAVRLHSGNFDFGAAKPDGSDLRVMAGDDKTPLPFHIERFDATNELALLWVQVPTVAPGSAQNTLYVYAGNAQAAAEPAANGGFDAATQAVFHFSDRDGRSQDGAVGPLSGFASGFLADANALLAGGVKLAGSSGGWPAHERVRWPAGGALTASLWLKPDAATGTVLTIGPLKLSLDNGSAVAQLGNVRLAGGALKAGSWQHLALVAAQGQLKLYVDGAEVASGAATLPELPGPVSLGGGYSGAVDELELSNVARSPDWLKLVASSQGVDSALVKTLMEDQGSAQAEGGGHNYFGILFANLTTDAWVVIGILAAMFVLAATVMVTKLLLVGRTDRANQAFVGRFRGTQDELLTIRDDGAAGSGRYASSSLYRLYQAGVRELTRREAQLAQRNLSPAALDAVKAAVDADLVRENHKLNAQMVWLTIAISGGPFLGLLGTVVGVMITFAAIAAAGDVNVNAIAPGIAAALLATVAGLGVAIPALFGYNYLAARIKNVSADMQIFVDEFITRVAETYTAN